MDPSVSRRMRGLESSLTARNGLAALFFGLTFAALIGASAWLAYPSRIWQQESAESRLADVVAQSVERHVEQLDLILGTVMGGDQTPAGRSLTPEQRNALLFQRVPRDRYIAFLEVLDANGGVLATSKPDEPSSNWANQEYFDAQRRNATKGLVVGKPFSTDSEDSVGVTISRRITTNDGRFGGIVVMGVRLAAFRELLSRHEFRPDESVTLLRDDSLVLMRLPFELREIGHHVEPPAPFYLFARGERPPFTAVDQRDHVERRFVFRRVGTLPLVVSVATPVEHGHVWPVPWWLAGGAVALTSMLALAIRGLWQEKRRRAAAERESQEKSRFLTTLSRELRTPLHGVLGHADQLLNEGKLEPAQSQQVAEIARAGKRMRGVVDLVLDYARIEALGPSLHMRRIDVQRMVEECMAIVEPEARVRGLETRITVAPGAPTQFVTDEVQIRQILVNLLSNAVKYTSQGAVELRVTGNQNHLAIEVADTGIGVPEGLRHLLFRKYERFETGPSGTEGTGLGLAIAHRLARCMGGHMGHRDNPGGGSVFWLELPAAVLDATQAAAEAGEIAPQRRLHVLVVDDSVVDRAVTTSFLRQAGHTAIEASDGGEAVRLATSHDFDVVLMDMNMAGVDGLEATRRIRALEGQRGQVPIIALTANALDQHVEACRQGGMSEHLAKPFTRTELLTAITRAAAQRPRPPSGAATTLEAMLSD
jgi:signal transduction histidine kinase/ActR/RegA family two-component response regulator